MVDTLVNLMLKRGYTVCLDDFQQVEADPLAQAFGRRLVAAAQADALSLVVTARSLPGFLQGVDFESLGGMSQQEARQLFMERKMPPLGGDLLERLHKLHRRKSPVAGIGDRRDSPGSGSATPGQRLDGKTGGGRSTCSTRWTA